MQSMRSLSLIVMTLAAATIAVTPCFAEQEINTTSSINGSGNRIDNSSRQVNVTGPDLTPIANVVSKIVENCEVNVSLWKGAPLSQVNIKPSCRQ